MKQLYEFLFLASAVFASMPLPGTAPSTYRDELYGFTIQAPAFPRIEDGGNVVPVMFFAPPAGGFANNITTMVQQASTTIDDYMELSKGQIKQAGFKLKSETRSKVSGRDAARFEYEGKAQGRPVRWLALAVVDKDRVFLITATAAADGFEKVEKEFRACLESFKLAE